MAFVVNLPYTVIGILVALLFIPREVRWNKKPMAVIVRVKSHWLPIFGKGWRGAVIGHVVILNPKEESKDLAHELVHVEQLTRAPFIGPFLYAWETITKGYKNNRYEMEAYERAGNKYYE